MSANHWRLKWLRLDQLHCYWSMVQNIIVTLRRQRGNHWRSKVSVTVNSFLYWAKLTPLKSWGFGIRYADLLRIPCLTKRTFASNCPMVLNLVTNSSHLLASLASPVAVSLNIWGRQHSSPSEAAALRSSILWSEAEKYFHGWMASREFRFGGFGSYTRGVKSGGLRFQMSRLGGGGAVVKCWLRSTNRSPNASNKVLDSNP